MPALLACTGIWLFGQFIHTDRLIAYSGLLLTAITIIKLSGSLFEIIGWRSPDSRVLVYTLVGTLIAIGLGVYYRHRFDSSLFPEVLTWSVIIAPCIGITEEFLFRGFIQGTIARYWPLLGILAGSISHTIYKYLVLSSHPAGLDIDFVPLILLTFGVGLLFGWFRLASRNILPAALSHGIFDIIVYGAIFPLPEWVW
jgi:membrane protease YdiL (CAAX protease family)